jgi:hypothetical protein
VYAFVKANRGTAAKKGFSVKKVIFAIRAAKRGGSVEHNAGKGFIGYVTLAEVPTTRLSAYAYDHGR